MCLGSPCRRKIYKEDKQVEDGTLDHEIKCAIFEKWSTTIQMTVEELGKLIMKFIGMRVHSEFANLIAANLRNFGVNLYFGHKKNKPPVLIKVHSLTCTRMTSKLGGMTPGDSIL